MTKETPHSHKELIKNANTTLNEADGVVLEHGKNADEAIKEKATQLATARDNLLQKVAELINNPNAKTPTVQKLVQETQDLMREVDAAIAAVRKLTSPPETIAVPAATPTRDTALPAPKTRALPAAEPVTAVGPAPETVAAEIQGSFGAAVELF